MDIIINQLKRNGGRKMDKVAAKMKKYTTQQLKDATLGLYKMKGQEALRAYQLAFGELEKRLGEDAFLEWCDSVGI